jgi:hypothetical protein
MSFSVVLGNSNSIGLHFAELKLGTGIALAGALDIPVYSAVSRRMFKDRLRTG